ncbi:MAG: hypothetical protein AABY07_03155 [Nanoarchaeota archaeon]
MKKKSLKFILLFLVFCFGWVAGIVSLDYYQSMVQKKENDICFVMKFGFVEGEFDFGQSIVMGQQLICVKELHISGIYGPKMPESLEDIELIPVDKIPIDFRALK